MIAIRKIILSQILICSIFLLLSNYVCGQTRKELEEKKKKTQEEIAYTNKLIKETQKNQQNSIQHLKLLDQKITMRKELINNINLEIELINKKINENSDLISSMEKDLKDLKNEYAKMIYFAYKNRNSYNRWMYILSSNDFNQAYKRLKYLQQYTEYRQRQAEAIKSIQKSIENKLAVLEKQKNEKQKLIKNQQEETITLSVEKNQQTKVLVNLKEKEQDLKKQLAEKRKSAQQLEKSIKDLIEKEAKASSGGTGTYKLTPEEKLISDQFGTNKGRLPWPTEKGLIIETFGEHEHPKLKGIKTFNDGITIATSEGSIARSIFGGVVRQIITIPGRHKTVIIRHGEYLSVYSNLKEVYVASGQKIKAKEDIGLIYTDNEGDNTTTLDLQIWKGTTKLNPSLWLSGK
ncbi:MAG: peptidoglycan DD-metalloendopeptidase family protein [Bacteroidota bacterium]